MASKGFGLGALGFGQLGGATLPGGNIRGFPYSPNAVEVPAHTYLLQNASTLPDPTSISLSVFHKRLVPIDSNFFEFGRGSDGFNIFRVTFNQKIQVWLVESHSSAVIYTSPVCYLEGQWNHIFVAFNTSTGIVIYVNGVLVGAYANTGLTKLELNGLPIQLPDPFQTSPNIFCNLQVYFGTYIDPSVPYFGGGESVAVNPQPLVNGQDRTNLIGMMVDAANIYGLPPTYPLTVANIESSYATTKPDPGLSNIFSFNKNEINGAGFNPPTVTSGTNATQQQEMNAFFYYNTVGNVPNSWLQPSTPSDPSGANTFLVFNMGAEGAQAIQNAAPGTLIQDLTTQSGAHIGNKMLNQTWAEGPQQGGRFGFPDALSGTSLVSDWMERFNGNYKGVDGAWIQAGFDASTRVTPAVGTYVNAFRDQNGAPVSPGIPQLLFGQQSLLFTGDKNNFPVNLGNGGPFTLFQGPLFDFSPPPP